MWLGTITLLVSSHFAAHNFGVETILVTIKISNAFLQNQNQKLHHEIQLICHKLSPMLYKTKPVLFILCLSGNIKYVCH